MSIKLAYLAGVLHGDGFCSDDTIGLKVADKDFAESFCEAINASFSICISVRPESKYWRVRTSNRKGQFSHIREYGPQTEEEIAAWIRGFFDSEGNASCCKRKYGEASYARRVSMYNTNVDTIRKATGFLGLLGIGCIVRATKNSRGHLGRKTVHELKLVSGVENYRLFQTRVSSSIGRKRDAIAQIVETYQPDKGYLVRAQAKGAESKRAKKLRQQGVSIH